MLILALYRFKMPLCFSLMTHIILKMLTCLSPSLSHVSRMFWFFIAARWITEGLVALNNCLICSQLYGLEIQAGHIMESLSLLHHVWGFSWDCSHNWVLLGCLTWDCRSGASVFALNLDPHFSTCASLCWCLGFLTAWFQVAPFQEERVEDAGISRASLQSYTVTSSIFCWSK